MRAQWHIKNTYLGKEAYDIHSIFYFTQKENAVMMNRIWDCRITSDAIKHVTSFQSLTPMQPNSHLTKVIGGKTMFQKGINEIVHLKYIHITGMNSFNWISGRNRQRFLSEGGMRRTDFWWSLLQLRS